MKNKNIFALIIIIILLIAFLAIFSGKKSLKNELEENYITSCGKYDNKEIIIDEKTLKVDISDNNCKRELGLSGRESLKNDEGMLFIFDKVGNHGFWMKDMKFPIDILWIDDDFSIVDVEKNVATSTYPQVFGKNYMSKYVLELPAGYSDKNNIKIENKIIF